MTQHSDQTSQPVLTVSTRAQEQFVAAYQSRPRVQTLPSIARLLSPTEKRVLPSAASSCNGLLDAASQVFAMLSKLKTETTCPHQEVLRREFLDELHHFEKLALQRGYPSAYLTVCRYVLCATIDDVLSHEIGFEHNTWPNHALLTEGEVLASDIAPDKFFAILARASETSQRYIDLLELMYLSLTYGYKGELRHQVDGGLILERMTNHLYERIRKERGHISQRLLIHAPILSKKHTSPSEKMKRTTIFSILMLALCIIMIIFIGLNYLMDVISNEAYRTANSPQQTILRLEKLE